MRVTTHFEAQPTQIASHTPLRPRIRPTHPYILFKPGEARFVNGSAFVMDGGMTAV